MFGTRLIVYLLYTCLATLLVHRTTVANLDLPDNHRNQHHRQPEQETSSSSSSSSWCIDTFPAHRAVALVNQTQTILCKIAAEIKICRFELPGKSGSLYLEPGQAKAEDGIEYWGEGFERGECGIKIDRVRKQHEGNYTCHLVPVDSRSEISATKRFTLAKPPLKPYLQFNYGMDTYDKTVYEIGESILISCTVEEAVPTANVSLYLGDQLLQKFVNPSKGQMIFEEITVINASRALTYDDNEKFVSCVVDHVALNKTYETKRQITVLALAPVVAEPQMPKMNVELELGESVSVDEGQTQTILCKMDIPLRLCRFMIPGEGSLVLDPDEESVADGPEYFGAGFDKGECGVKLSPVKSQHAGDITCFLLPKISKARKEESRTIHLVVNSFSKDTSSSSSTSR
ncbi:hypothetical protein TKK_0019039 [Trichogramma kaykai]|uniref:Ig-like domain-containing protein n=1 Tax=Trichogramma kaykai TaxID=54128 RepID=A0ABD2VUS3_9HYME